MRGRTLFNFGGYLFFFFGSAIVTILFSPLILTNLGPSAFGTWRVLLRCSETVLFLDGRASQALKAMVPRMPFINGGVIDRRPLMQSITYSAKFGIPLFVISVVVILLAQTSRLSIPFTQISFDTATLHLGAALLLVLALSQVLYIPDALFTGRGLSYISSIALLFYIFLQGFLTWVFTTISPSLTYVAAAAICSFFVAALILLFLSWRLFHVSMQPPSNDCQKSLSELTVPHLVWSVFDKLLLNLDILMLAALFGSSAAADFSFFNYFSVLPLGILVIFGAVYAPILSRAHGKHVSTDGVEEILITFVLTASATAGVLLLLFGSDLLGLWVPALAYSFSTLDWLILSASIVATAYLRIIAQLEDSSMQNHGRIASLFIFLFSTAISFLIFYLNKDFLKSLGLSLFSVAMLSALTPKIALLNLNGAAKAAKSHRVRYAFLISILMLLCVTWLETDIASLNNVALKLLLAITTFIPAALLLPKLLVQTRIINDKLK